MTNSRFYRNFRSLIKGQKEAFRELGETFISTPIRNLSRDLRNTPSSIKALGLGSILVLGTYAGASYLKLKEVLKENDVKCSVSYVRPPEPGGNHWPTYESKTVDKSELRKLASDQFITEFRVGYCFK